MIVKLTVRNYKSLRHIELPLGSFLTFVGPNNSGKSNILDALQFLRDFVSNPTGAVSLRGGIGDLMWDGDLGQTLGLGVHGRGSPALGFSEQITFTYDIELTGRPDQTFSLVRERFVAGCRVPAPGSTDPVELQLSRSGEIALLEYPDRQGMGVLRDVTGKVLANVGIAPQNSYLAHFGMTPESNWVIGGFKAALQRWSFYNFVPSRMQRIAPVRKDLQPGFEGEAVSTVMHTLHSEFPQLFREIEELLRTGVPELEGLMTALADQEGQTYVAARERGLSVRIKPWMMSDGTLRLMAHLVALFSPLAPPLVCFEEPENYVHFHLAELLASTLKRASHRSQVLVTTHSPFILNALEPEDVFVVEKEEGSTRVSAAADRAGLREALQRLRLGELWYSGAIGGVP